MGLAVAVGMLSDLLENDPEGAEWLKGAIQSANSLLAANGLPAHVEPTIPFEDASRCSLDSYPYSFLHYLRRIYAHVARDPNWLPQPVEDDEDPAEDPLVEEETMQMQSHLLSHSDAEGFYFPIDFEDVIFDDGGSLPGGMLGSTQRLIQELITLAPYLGIKLQNGELSDAEASRLNEESEAQGPFWIEKCVWLSLFEAARLSLKYNAAICFT
jgi:hypothetical protein